MPSPTAKQLRESRAKVAHQIRTLADRIHAESRDFNAEEKTEWEKVNEDYNRLSRQIDAVERADKIDRDLRRRANDPDVGRGDPRRRDRAARRQPTDEQRTLALNAWFRAQMGADLTRDQRRAARACNLNPAQRTLTVTLGRAAPRTEREARDLSIVSGPAGGYLVAPNFIRNLERALLYFGPMRQIAQIIRTDTGGDMPWPTANDTTNKGALLSENTDGGTHDVAVGKLTWKAHKYTSKMVKCPVELMEDSEFDVAALLAEMLGERLARAQNEHFTTGDGAAKPVGAVTAATLGVTAAANNAIAADELLNLQHAVDRAYRQQAAWMMNDQTLLHIRKLKDTTNNYLFQSSLREGEPDRLLGQTLHPNNDMATIAAAAKTVLYGDFRYYKIREVRTVRFRRLVERFADTDQEGFVAFSRVDGNLLDAGGRPVKYLAHP